MNEIAVKNQLIFDFASGILGPAKSIFASTYLQLNSNASKISNTFENMLAENFSKLSDVAPKNLKYTDCINTPSNNDSKTYKLKNPLSRLIGDFNTIDWKSVYKGFKEYSLPLKDNDSVKLIKMDPGTSVPLHSHNGKEFILVLEGSFFDEY